MMPSILGWMFTRQRSETVHVDFQVSDDATTQELVHLGRFPTQQELLVIVISCPVAHALEI
jgi:hypothetical protein